MGSGKMKHGGRRKIAADMLIDNINETVDNKDRPYITEIDLFILTEKEDIERWRMIKNNPDLYVIMDEKKSINTISKTAIYVIEFRDHSMTYHEEKYPTKKKS